LYIHFFKKDPAMKKVSIQKSLMCIAMIGLFSFWLPTGKKEATPSERICAKKFVLH
jgi:hypothetical protein